MEPFVDSKSVARWAASILQARGGDEIANWRMLEYWFQAELFRAVQSGQAGSWQHVGDYEHPYHTKLPRSGSKTNTKWIDLVLAHPDADAPDSVAWIELKDIGRSVTTALNNAKGLGYDLAALWTLDPSLTKDLWINPLPHSLDRGRLVEWNRFGPGIDCSHQLISQIVICHKSLFATVLPADVERLWMDTFRLKCCGNEPQQPLQISRSESSEFLVYGLLGKLGQ